MPPGSSAQLLVCRITGAEWKLSKTFSQGPSSLHESKSLKLTPPFISVLNNETIDETHRLYINMNKVSGSGKCRQLPFPGSAGLLVNIQHRFFSSYRKKAHIATLNLYRCKLTEKTLSYPFKIGRRTSYFHFSMGPVLVEEGLAPLHKTEQLNATVTKTYIRSFLNVLIHHCIPARRRGRRRK